MLACMKCLSKAGLAQVPACKPLRDNPATSGVPIDKLDETQRQCYCGLITATEWTRTCSGPQQQCNATIVDIFLQGFAHVKSYVCPAQNLSGQKSGAQKGHGQGRAVVMILQVSAWMTVLVLSVISALL
ncbi:hypothetical protein BGW39_004163 [Mortierella sp. 14UC]|nr:hypothetical protein BGW39_004163 [Mortierella sp. 14UC]